MFSSTDRVVHVVFGITRAAAIKSGVEWKISVSDFFYVWEPYWVGRNRSRYYMRRRNDAGAFEAGNVYIDIRDSGSLKARKLLAWSRERDPRLPSWVEIGDVRWP